MYAVGVGNAVEDELREIASEPTKDHYFYTADFKTMNQIAKKLHVNICEGEGAAEAFTHTYEQTLLHTHKCSFTHIRAASHTNDASHIQALLHKIFVSFLFLSEENPCECDSIVSFQKKVENAIQALTKKYILF